MSETEATETETTETPDGGEIEAPLLRNSEDLRVEVEILDERKLFGRRDYRITPVAGEGEAWVAAHNVETDGD